jgi:hypothetical protein
MRSFSSYSPWAALLAGCCCCLGACGGSHDDVAKRLASLQTELGQVQSHSDRLEQRLQALEMRQQSATVPRPAADAATAVERPRLMIVKLQPGEESRDTAAPDAPTAALGVEESTTDQSPRPLIRVYGSRTEVGTGSDSAKRKR